MHLTQLHDGLQATTAWLVLQVQSNALAALEAIDADMAAEIMAEGCMTGDRINGLCDGVSGDWYVKFDTFHPAVDNGFPVTRVISRVTLQQILAKYAIAIGGEQVIQPDTKVVSYEEDSVDGHDRVRPAPGACRGEHCALCGYSTGGHCRGMSAVDQRAIAVQPQQFNHSQSSLATGTGTGTGQHA